MCNFAAKGWKMCAKCRVEIYVDNEKLLDDASRILQEGSVVVNTNYGSPGLCDGSYNGLGSTLFRNVPMQNDALHHAVAYVLWKLIKQKVERVFSVQVDRATVIGMGTDVSLTKSVKILKKCKQTQEVFNICLSCPPISNKAIILWFSHAELAKHIPIFAGKKWIQHVHPNATIVGIPTRYSVTECINAFPIAFTHYAELSILNEDAVSLL